MSFETITITRSFLHSELLWLDLFAVIGSCWWYELVCLFKLLILSQRFAFQILKWSSLTRWSRISWYRDVSNGPLSSARLFACTAHSFDFSTLLALLARSLTHSLLSLRDSGIFLFDFQGVLNHCALKVSWVASSGRLIRFHSLLKFRDSGTRYMKSGTKKLVKIHASEWKESKKSPMILTGTNVFFRCRQKMIHFL